MGEHGIINSMENGHNFSIIMNTKENKQAIEKQDLIFKKMSASKKVKVASDLTMLCLKLNQPNGNHRPGKASFRSNLNSR